MSRASAADSTTSRSPEQGAIAGIPCPPDGVDDFLSEATAAVCAMLGRVRGDFMVLGAAGKMGLHVCLMLRRALDANHDTRRVIAVSRFIVGGLLRQFGVWTRRAVELLEEIKAVRENENIPAAWLSRNAAWTDANAAVFDAANGYAGVICGIHEVLRRQGIFATDLCLNPHEKLSPGRRRNLIGSAPPTLG